MLIHQALATGSLSDASVVVEDTINRVAQVVDPLTEWEHVLLANQFLCCCALYKFLLWQFCAWYAIPKTGSSVLVALAGDKRNDCLCTTFIIAVTFFAKIHEDAISYVMEPEDVDPFVSLVLSVVIMYIWSQFVVEEATCLSCVAVEPAFKEQLQRSIDALLQEHDALRCRAEVVAYYSSHHQCTVEVSLCVERATGGIDVMLGTLDRCMCSLRQHLLSRDDVERAIVVPRSARGAAGLTFSEWSGVYHSPLPPRREVPRHELAQPILSRVSASNRRTDA